jgi:hypothetical protein
MLDTNRRTRLVRRIAAPLAIVALAAPAAAFADESTVGGYGGVGGVTQGGVSSGTPKAAASAPAAPVQQVQNAGGSGSLPFTGFDAYAVVAVGLMLAGAGLALRRLSERGHRSKTVTVRSTRARHRSRNAGRWAIAPETGSVEPDAVLGPFDQD